jgi:cell division protease FtsH
VSEELPPLGEFAWNFVRFMQAVHELAEGPDSVWLARVREHLSVEPRELPVTAAGFRMADRPNLQLALDAVLEDPELVGTGGEGIDPLLSGMRMGPRARTSPVQWADVEIGDGAVMRCIAGALVLTTFEGKPVAFTIGHGGEHPHPHFGGNQPEVRIEGISPDEGAVSRLLAAIRAAMLEHNIFRGRVISLSATGAVRFESTPEVARERVILPDGVLERLEQHALGISAHAPRLREAGRHLKRGILLHGPPGTGKTLTVNYLLTATRGRTTVLLTGGGLAQVESAFGIARDLAPATVVLEDVDLVAAERFTRGSGGVLFELLNELEGLDDDADLLVVLTTNRPDVIEPALAARPGRVDLALEAPLPDAGGRERLLRLYAGEIAVADGALQQLVAMTEGVTGAFIKELMRQATLRAATEDRAAEADDVQAIAAELLDERAALTRRLLGHGAGGEGSGLGEPLPTMSRAVAAAGLPMPQVVRRRPLN